MRSALRLPRRMPETPFFVFSRRRTRAQLFLRRLQKVFLTRRSDNEPHENTSRPRTRPCRNHEGALSFQRKTPRFTLKIRRERHYRLPEHFGEEDASEITCARTGTYEHFRAQQRGQHHSSRSSYHFTPSFSSSKTNLHTLHRYFIAPRKRNVPPLLSKNSAKKIAPRTKRERLSAFIRA